MPPSPRLWPLLIVLLSGAAAHVGQTPEPPGAVIYDRHWPYMAPGGSGNWWWRPQLQRQRQRQGHYWRREARAGLAPAELAPAGLAQAGLAQAELAQAGLAQAGLTRMETSPTRSEEQEQETRGKEQELSQESQVRDQSEEQDQEETRGKEQELSQESQVRDQSEEQDQEQEQGQDRDQDQRQVENWLHRWPEFLQTSSDSDEAPSEILSRQRRKHGRPQRWKMQRLCEERDECTCYSHKTRATFCCDCLWGSCFPADAGAVLPDGRTRRMEHLTAGDRVMTVDPTGDLVQTTILGFLDRRPGATGEYLHLHLRSGHLLRLSANHITFARRRPEGLFAGDVRPGDELMVEAGNGTAVYSAVRSVTYRIMTGAFVPLTEHGTLLVDGVMASNYASFPHGLSHALTAPLRLWPSLLSDWFVVDEKNVLVGWLKSLGKLLVETPSSGVVRLTSL